MPRRAARPLAIALAAALVASALPASALAQGTTTPQQGVDTVDIGNCAVKRSRNSGGFTWFTCMVTWSVPAGQKASVTYTANLASFTPKGSSSGPDWSPSTKTLKLQGDAMQAFKIAVKNRNLTVAQVKQRLKVTLSNPVGITIGDGTATATGASASAAGLVSSDPSGATTQGVVVDIHNCAVRRSRNAGGFTWASCGMSWTGPSVQNGSVRWRSNLTTFTPKTAGTWSAASGTRSISGGDGIWGFKFAFKNLTVAQVKQRLKVTLSNPQNVTIGDATAVAAGS